MREDNIGFFSASFQVLSSLAQLPSLDNLGLKTPTYDPNPVGVLCNYFTQVIYHLPDLQMLDGSDVTSKVIREVTEVRLHRIHTFTSFLLHV